MSELIGSGQNGCTYRPPLPVTESKLNQQYGNDNYVMKVSNNFEDLTFEAKLQKLDPKQQYFVYALACGTPTNLPGTAGIPWCFPLNTEKPVSACYMSYGGINLETYEAELEGKLSYTTFANIATNLIQGLALLHTQFAHRDIRRSNIILSDDHARFIDFDYIVELSQLKPELAIQKQRHDQENLLQILLDLAQYVEPTEAEKSDLEAYIAALQKAALTAREMNEAEDEAEVEKVID